MSDAASCRSARRLGVSEGIRLAEESNGQGFRVTAVASAGSASGAAPMAGTGPEQQATGQDQAAVEQPARPSQQVAPEQLAAAQQIGGPPVAITNSIGMQFVLIPPGEFVMGSPATGSATNIPELQHLVRMTKPFHLGVHEVTQGQYERVMQVNPGEFKDPQNPVDQVSWLDAVGFCDSLSALAEEQAAGRRYRLPTEAEWEYACRAWSTSRYSFGESDSLLGDYAWHVENAGLSPHAVGQKLANAWGLFDMHGNVWEWCADWYGPDYYAHSPQDDPTGPEGGTHRVCRGGGAGSPPVICRSASRSGTSGLNYNTGFRVAAALAVENLWRTSRTADGKFSVRAKFVKLDGETVTLEKTNGNTVDVKLDVLCAEDQDYMKQVRDSSK
jgi:formylglycine-generating enzyme required for sulfatase activity